MDGFSSGSCPLSGCGVSGYRSYFSATRELNDCDQQWGLLLDLLKLGQCFKKKSV